MLAGLQGAGKTTLAGKLGLWLKEQGHSPLLVAADLQRPNAVNQLQVVAERAGVAVYAPEPGNGVGDPVEVAQDSHRAREAKLHDVVIVDTAGRLGIDAELMQQAARHPRRRAARRDPVRRRRDDRPGRRATPRRPSATASASTAWCSPSSTATPAVVPRSPSSRVTGQPIMFASTGEKLDDFDVFHPDRMASRILDMGDMLTLIEQAEKTFDAGAGREDGRQAGERARTSPSTTSSSRWSAPEDGLASPSCSGCCPGMGADQGPDRQHRRARRRPHRRDHPVDDAGRARRTRRSSTARAAPASPTAPASRSARSTTWSSGSSRRRR